jgi:hypothetical protein
MYLEGKNKVHRDISYTNILLREPGRDSDLKQQIKNNFKNQLNLSEIELLRKDLKCREGLLIDYDYAAGLFASQKGQDKEGEGDENEADAVTDDPSAVANVSGDRTVSLL